MVIGLTVGTGFGSVSGTASETQQPVSSGGMAWSRAAHVAPMIGYFVTPQLLLGVQARIQIVSGANEYWGVQETDWNDAPVLHGASFSRRIAGRRYDLYYAGPHLHMVVLRSGGASGSLGTSDGAR